MYGGFRGSGALDLGVDAGAAAELGDDDSAVSVLAVC